VKKANVTFKVTPDSTAGEKEALSRIKKKREEEKRTFRGDRTKTNRTKLLGDAK